MVSISYNDMVKRKIPEIARMSSKGQVVIPKVFRNAMKLTTGAPMAVDMRGDMLIMKPIRSPIEEEDFRILKEVEEAWEEIERGEYKRAKVEDFLREIKEW
jgi:bifunctional DNA-binding transcriptional regulator/antitoxin component of YhaV-PrlF toxin-antitoxin module